MKQWTPKTLQYIPPRIKMAWEPNFSEEGATKYVKFSPGLVNNFIATNFDKKFPIPSSGKVYFNLQITSDLTATTFSLTAVTIVLESNPPATMKAVKNGPPGNFKISLGVYDQGDYFMFYNQNINITPVEAFKTDKVGGPKNVGEDPFDRWFTWMVF
jgi:hypothetical protein